MSPARTGEVKQVSLAQGEGVDVLELDLGDVRSTLPRLDRGPQLLVVRAPCPTLVTFTLILGYFVVNSLTSF